MSEITARSVVLATAITGVAALGLLPVVQAHEGHEPHETQAPAAVQKALPAKTSGELFARQPLNLPGRVVVDAGHDIRITADQNGVVEKIATGQVSPGQTVRRGQVLARLRPVFSQPERRDLSIDQVSSARDALIGRRQVERYQLDGTTPFDIRLPTPTLQLLADYRGAQAKEAQLTQALDGDVPIVAPGDGVILHNNTRSDGVVVAGQTLFELRRPAGLAIAVEYPDDDLDVAHAQSALATAGAASGIQFLGQTYDPALRVHRALYAVLDADSILVPGESVTVPVPRRPAGLDVGSAQ